METNELKTKRVKNITTLKDNLSKLRAVTAETIALRVPTPCAVERCIRPIKSHKSIFCKSHYAQFRRTGSTDTRPHKPYKPRAAKADPVWEIVNRILDSEVVA